MAANRAIGELLKDRFAATRSIDALVKHFKAAVDEYHKGEWEKSLAKGGKFIEAVLKALLVEANLPAQSGRQFKVDKAINDLGGLPSGGVDEAISLTIPRCCRFVYDVTSNRGGPTIRMRLMRTRWMRLQFLAAQPGFSPRWSAMRKGSATQLRLRQRWMT